MSVVQVRNVAIGEGRPKICVPIADVDREGILRTAEKIRSLPVDVAEWRADWYQEVESRKQVLDTAAMLRRELGDIPLLFTFRTDKEGGQRAISGEDYVALNVAVAESGLADLVDVEVFIGKDLAAQIISAAHRACVAVVGSNHDFEKTPEKDELVRRLCWMQQMGADILKIAVMPRSERDVLTLLDATLEMKERHTPQPVVTMSMSGRGVVSRLAGEVFGSAMTFGTAGKASAPGQIDVQVLAEMLKVFGQP